MKNIIKYTIFALLSVLITTSCDPQESNDHKLGPAPTTDELAFTITPSSETPNVLILKNTSSRAGVAIWDLGNYIETKGDNVNGEYPFQGEYTITMTLYTTGGSTSISKNVTITDNDFTLLDTKMYNDLTGGFDAVDGKTWIFDQNEDGHFGVYPDDNSWSWNAPPNNKVESSLYKQEFTFSMSKITGLKLIWKNEGKIYTNDAGKAALAADGYPNATVPPAGDWDVEFTPKDSYSFVINEVAKILTLTDGAFFGHYAGTSVYKIVQLTENKLEVTCSSLVEPGNNWRYQFIPKP